MTKENYIEITKTLKNAILSVTEVHSHNKAAYKHNCRYCLESSGKYNPDTEKIQIRDIPTKYDFGWESSGYVLTCLIIFYNKFRGRKPHSHNDELFTNSCAYRQIETYFNGLIVEEV